MKMVSIGIIGILLTTRNRDLLLDLEIGVGAAVLVVLWLKIKFGWSLLDLHLKMQLLLDRLLIKRFLLGWVTLKILSMIGMIVLKG